MISQGHIQQESRMKKIMDFGKSVLLYTPYSTDVAPSDIHLFRSLQNPVNDKNFSQEDQVKTFMENLLGLKPTEFYLRGNNKLLDKLREVNQNNGEYTIVWNLFIVELFMSKLYFTKTKIIYDSMQYIYIYMCVCECVCMCVYNYNSTYSYILLSIKKTKTNGCKKE